MDVVSRKAFVDRDGSQPVTVAVGSRVANVSEFDEVNTAPAEFKSALSTVQDVLDDSSSQHSRKLHPSRSTLFVGGISVEVARDPRILTWFAASMFVPGIPVRKVVPHKEARKNAAGTQSKLSLSAFVVVDQSDSEPFISGLHHRVLWDVGGAWVATTPAGETALFEYINTQCTWQRREAAAAAGLPRHLMTVEVATSATSSSHSGRANTTKTA